MKEPMKPRKGRRFRKATKYPHNRSEGMTRRRNGGSRYQPDERKDRDHRYQ